MILKGGKLYYDTPIGVLCLESYFPKPPGHVRNPRTFDFPVVCKVVQGVDVPRLLLNPTSDLVEPFIDAARALEREGVLAVTGSCGFLSMFQEDIASALSIPVFTSSLIQIPMVRVLHGPGCRIGVLTASSAALTPAHFSKVGGRMDDVVIKGMEGFPEFWETIIENKRLDFDMDRLEREILQAASDLNQANDLDAIVLECTDLSAFSHSIQQALQIPIYDIDSLVEYVHYAVCRRRF